MKKLFVIFLSLFAIVGLYAQKINNLSYSFSIGEGYVLPTNDFLKGVNEDNKKITNLTHFSLKVSKETDNSKPWHTRYNDLRYGLGAFYGIFNYSKNLGNPFSLYAFAGFTPWKNETFSFKNELAVGLSGIWDYYSENNPHNIAVSMPVEAYIHFDFQFFWHMKNNWQLNTGLSFIHFSNGAVIKPNKGINIASYSLGLTYTPEQIVKYDVAPKPQTNKKYNYFTNIWVGSHAVWFNYEKTSQEKDTIKKSYVVTGLQQRVIRNINDKYSVGLGVDLVYNSSIGKTDSVYLLHPEKRNYDFVDRMSAGFYLSFQYNINKLSVLVEPGYAFWQVHGYAPKQYQRLGLRYNFAEHFFAHVALRAYNYHVADFIEWGLGFKL